MSELRTDFKDEILQEGEEHRVYNIKRKGTDEVVESEVYLEKAYEALQEGDEFGAKDVNEIHVRLNGLASMNLLINSDFRNPINQRGATSYTVEYTGTYQYTIDRWCTIWSENTVSVVDGGVQLEKRGAIIQRLEHKLEAGKKYTLSWSIDGVKDSVLITGGDYEQQSSRYSLDGDYERIIIYNDSDGGIINWAKLEAGSVATPLVPRPYGEELALCQRYYMKILAWESSYPFRGDNNAVCVFLSGIQMRTHPTIIGGAVKFVGIATGIASSNGIANIIEEQISSTIVGAYQRNNGVEIHYIKANTVVNFGIAVIESTMDLDAEIY